MTHIRNNYELIYNNNNKYILVRFGLSYIREQFLEDKNCLCRGCNMASIQIIFLKYLSTFIHMYFTKGKEKKEVIY